MNNKICTTCQKEINGKVRTEFDVIEGTKHEFTFCSECSEFLK